MSGLSDVFAFMDDCFPGTRLTVKVGDTVLDKDSLRKLEERPLENKEETGNSQPTTQGQNAQSSTSPVA